MWGLNSREKWAPGAGRLVGRAGVGWSGLKPPRLPGAPGGRKAPAQRQHPEPRVWWRQSGEDSRAAQPQRFSVLGQPCVKDQLNRSCPGCRAGRGDPGGQRQSPDRALVGQGRVCLAGGFGLLVARAEEPPPPVRAGGVCLRRDPAGPGPQAAHWGPWLGKLRPGSG
ncbi:hypothetical protein NDU88_004973 [Pleurodeles waltl]|uniref:Uncharacterized protein n=1 Tax=Pleurodeles waltl TaxID=8319 RepID=A0AAV7MZX5_PLEWA|nr:hypothetical protein NDU88_004973 [Pleurodeles waltl]